MCQKRHRREHEVRRALRCRPWSSGAPAPTGGCRARPRAGRAAARARPPPRSCRAPSVAVATANASERRRVAVAQGARLAALLELVQRVLADRLEHREPDVAVEVVADPDEALLREPLEAADDVERHGRRRGSRTPTPRSRSGRRPRTRRGARTAAGPPDRAGRGSSRSRRAASAGAPAGRARPPTAGPAGRRGAAPSRRATGAGSGRRRARSPAAGRRAGGRSRRRGGRSRRVSAKSGRTAIARSTNSRTASDASERPTAVVTPSGAATAAGPGTPARRRPAAGPGSTR